MQNLLTCSITGEFHAKSVAGIDFWIFAFQSSISNPETVCKCFGMDGNRYSDGSADGTDKVPSCSINLVYFKP